MKNKHNNYAIASARGKQWSDAEGYPMVTGTAKQQEWALAIRHKLVPRLLDADAVIAQGLEAELKLQTSAEWWIMHRFSVDPATLLGELEASPSPQPTQTPKPITRLIPQVHAAVMNIDAIFIHGNHWVN
jgi:hypothetical protein